MTVKEGEAQAIAPVCSGGRRKSPRSVTAEKGDERGVERFRLLPKGIELPLNPPGKVRICSEGGQPIENPESVPASPTEHSPRLFGESVSAEGLGEEGGRRAFQIVGLIEHETLKGREDRRRLIPGTGAPYREITEDKMVVGNEDLGRGSALTRPENETPFPIGTAGGGTGVVFAVDPVPFLTGDVKRQVAPRTGWTCFGPFSDGANTLPVGEEIRLRLLLRKSPTTQVVAAPLHQCDGYISAQAALHQREIVLHQLLLQVDRRRRDDDALAVGRRPGNGRYEVGKGLPDTGTRLGDGQARVVERLGHLSKHCHLGRAFPKSRELQRDGSGIADRFRESVSVEENRFFRKHRLNEDVDPLHPVVNDCRADSRLGKSRGHRYVRITRAKHTARMVVDNDIAPLTELDGSGNGGITSPSVDLHRRNESIVVDVSHEEDLLAVGFSDFATHGTERIAADSLPGTGTHKS
jgi:hypothetical protein